jgi:hypothetical protein
LPLALELLQKEIDLKNQKVKEAIGERAKQKTFTIKEKYTSAF